MHGYPDIVANNMFVLNERKFNGITFDMFHQNFWNVEQKFLFPLLLAQNFICCSSSTLSIDFLKSMGGFQSRFSADHSMWLEASLRRRKINFNSYPIGFYRFHQQGSSSGKATENNVWAEVQDIQQQFLPYLSQYVNQHLSSRDVNALLDYCKSSEWPTAKIVQHHLNTLI